MNETINLFESKKNSYPKTDYNVLCALLLLEVLMTVLQKKVMTTGERQSRWWPRATY